MIVSKNTVGSSSTRGGLYSVQKGFAVRRPSISRTSAYEGEETADLTSLADNTSIYRLRNDYVDFIFRQDTITGVRLDKFKYITGSKYFVNYSRKLWELAIRRSTFVDNIVNNNIFVDKYYIRPDDENFIAPSVVPAISNTGEASFTFIWDNVKYNYLDPTKTCKVKVVASLGSQSKSIKLTLSLTSNHAIGPADNTVCISAVGMPSISVRKYGDDDYHAKDFLAVPVLEGSTILDPIKRLTSPRFPEDSFQFNESSYKNYFLSPDRKVTRASFTCPGMMTVPILSYGNLTDREGFSYIAYDPEGIHAKNFTYYSDSSSLHLRCYDLSDHAVDPWGMGGKDTTVGLLDTQQVTLNPPPPGGSQVYGSTVNNIGWSIVIRPYVSPTIWADYYASVLYKKEIVPDLEEAGVVQPSFVSRVLSNSLSKKAAEMPSLLVAFGFLSGDVSPALSGISYLQELYKSSTFPSQNSVPDSVAFHYYANSQPIPESVTGIASSYIGWETWAMQPGVSTGWEVSKSPDYLNINSGVSGVFLEHLKSGHTPMVYLIHPYTISSGSAFTDSFSGIDFVRKPHKQEDRRYTNSEYTLWARGIVPSNPVEEGVYQCCPSIQHAYNHNTNIAIALASKGTAIYHDTVGLELAGCMAKRHTYVKSGIEVSVSHPRALSSYYFNKMSDLWISASANAANSNAHPNWETYIGSTSGNHFNLPSASEFPGESILKNLNSALITTAYSSVSQYGFSPTTLSAYWSGAPRSDMVKGNLSSLDYVAAAIEKPNWLRQNPIFSTIYGDRCMLYDWIGISVGNGLSGMNFDSSWVNDPIGGYDVFGAPNVSAAAHQSRVTQNRNWLATRFNTFARVTNTYQSPQYAAISPTWSQVTETMSGTLDNPIWSGVKSFMQKMYRLLAYAPDYMYHGYIEHYLESWRTENDYSAYGPRSLRVSRPVNSNEWSKGDDAVIHGARRHYDGNSILVWLSNWTTGNATFSGIFDPSKYEIYDSYNVKSIGLNDDDNGDLVDIGFFGPTDTYTINLTLGEGEFKAFLFEPITTITSSQFTSLRTEYTYLRYEYV